MSEFLLGVLILIMALLLDAVIGDPRSKFHPVVLVGSFISLLDQNLPRKNSFIDYIVGVCTTLLTLLLVFSITYLAIKISALSPALLTLISIFLLKFSISVKSMEQHSLDVVEALKVGDLQLARDKVKLIVSRDTKSLDEEHILSACVESISENTVDGITAPLFFYALLGPIGAFLYRTINTLDAMLGYKSPKYVRFGKFSASLDTIANYVPARLTALLMIVASYISRYDWKRAYFVLKRDRRKTDSLNAGWTMSAVAGALRVKLEKKGHYVLGDPLEQINIAHVYKALKIMKLTTVLLILVVVLPLLYFTAKFWLAIYAF